MEDGETGSRSSSSRRNELCRGLFEKVRPVADEHSKVETHIVVDESDDHAADGSRRVEHVAWCESKGTLVQ